MYMGAWQEYKLACILAEQSKLVDERRKQKLRELDFSRLKASPPPIHITTTSATSSHSNASYNSRHHYDFAPASIAPPARASSAVASKADQVIGKLARETALRHAGLTMVEKKQLQNKGNSYPLQHPYPQPQPQSQSQSQSQSQPQRINPMTRASSASSVAASTSISSASASTLLNQSGTQLLAGRLGNAQALSDVMALRSALKMDQKDYRKPFMKMKLKRPEKAMLLSLPVAPTPQELAEVRRDRVQKLRGIYNMNDQNQDQYQNRVEHNYKDGGIAGWTSSPSPSPLAHAPSLPPIHPSARPHLPPPSSRALPHTHPHWPQPRPQQQHGYEDGILNKKNVEQHQHHDQHKQQQEHSLLSSTMVRPTSAQRRLFNLYGGVHNKHNKHNKQHTSTQGQEQMKDNLLINETIKQDISTLHADDNINNININIKEVLREAAVVTAESSKEGDSNAHDERMTVNNRRTSMSHWDDELNSLLDWNQEQ